MKNKLILVWNVLELGFIRVLVVLRVESALPVDVD